MSMYDVLTSQGARAVRSGRYGEGILEAAFGAFKVKGVDDNPQYHRTQIFPRSDSLLIKQHALSNGRKIDFLFKNFKSGLNLCIECKQQMQGGTTDEKLHYTVDMLEQCGYPAFWLVLSGKGFSVPVVGSVRKKIGSLTKVKGRLIVNEGPFLQRAIERLIEHGEI